MRLVTSRKLAIDLLLFLNALCLVLIVYVLVMLDFPSGIGLDASSRPSYGTIIPVSLCSVFLSRLYSSTFVNGLFIIEVFKPKP